jgi:hypothetical protein
VKRAKRVNLWALGPGDVTVTIDEPPRGHCLRRLAVLGEMRRPGNAIVARPAVSGRAWPIASARMIG